MISLFLVIFPISFFAQEFEVSKNDIYKELFFSMYLDYNDNLSSKTTVFGKSFHKTQYYEGDSLEKPVRYYYEGWSHFDRFGVKFRFKIKKARLPDNLNDTKCYKVGIVNYNNYRVFYDSIHNADESMSKIKKTSKEEYQKLLQMAMRIEDYLDSVLYIERMRSIKNPDNSIYLSYLEKGKDQRIYYIHSQKNIGRLIVKISPKYKRMLTKHGYCVREEMYNKIEKIIESLSTTTQDDYSVIYVDGECAGDDQ
ncbi:hypothetical protein GCM10009118_22610 [Wandonia haliotis]|uniref:Uncharacterized protein n=1 Tax=Wandonia haliotis TaxID=574963 RepID=A0ABN1MR63_9FLAO